MELPKYATEDTEKVPYLDFGMAHWELLDHYW